ncbi:hypothetical protein PACTADRAFT_49336 [Pachysolen tannophilus NRRL Y-2460]|uniref:Uncharacterized protein n=1 Tax=Pachysolen tannophilus NRRL Y-2460 TaxID=669874 RepID=A0A1E4TVZ2_PACTA|nr:hypothetical protein PACTADRAFT_49336 [Pachysolen tannophilus NRRL Y-2460]
MPINNANTNILEDRSYNEHINNNNAVNTGLFSPHNSVFQALNNPSLELSSVSRTNSRNISNSPDLTMSSQFSQYSANDFSSWQLVHNSTQNSGRSSGSILSSSDTDDQMLNNFSLGQHHNHSNLTNQVIIFDNESELHSESYEDEDDVNVNVNVDVDVDVDADVDDDLVENASTLHQIEKLSMPSFIMPRVSLEEVNSNSANIDPSRLRINVVGHGSFELINRLNCYSKILKNIDFTNVNPNLIILIVDHQNLLLPQRLEKPFIPIFIEEQIQLGKDFNADEMSTSSGTNSQLLASRLNSLSTICHPIHLKSLNDDLFPLIHILSNIDCDKFNALNYTANKDEVREPCDYGCNLFTRQSDLDNSTRRYDKLSRSALNKRDKKISKRKNSGSNSNNNNNNDKKKIISTKLSLLLKIINGKVIVGVGYIGLCYCVYRYFSEHCTAENDLLENFTKFSAGSGVAGSAITGGVTGGDFYPESPFSLARSPSNVRFTSSFGRLTENLSSNTETCLLKLKDFQELSSSSINEQFSELNDEFKKILLDVHAFISNHAGNDLFKELHYIIKDLVERTKLAGYWLYYNILY